MVTAAANGHAELAISNAVGGIAAQTAFMAIANRQIFVMSLIINYIFLRTWSGYVNAAFIF